MKNIEEFTNDFIKKVKNGDFDKHVEERKSEDKEITKSFDEFCQNINGMEIINEATLVDPTLDDVEKIMEEELKEQGPCKIRKK